MKHKIFLGLGTNVGDREENLRAAIKALVPNVVVKRQSAIYETAPWGYKEQASFLNMVIEAETSLSPTDLLDKLKKIEEEIGRTKTFRYGPREIDIDILFYNSLVHEEAELSIPHPRVHERVFMLVPLSDIAHDLEHPILEKSISELLENLYRGGIIKYIAAKELEINEKTFAWGSRTYVMGIINVTPDSFSGDGLHRWQDPVVVAIEQAKRFIDAGVDMLDIGGESTRPGSEPVKEEEEKRRVLPIVEAIADQFDTVISIDTYKAKVAKAALGVGADLINDVWGLQADPDMGALAAKHNLPVILMHNRSNPKTAEVQAQLGGRYTGVNYENLIKDVKNELLHSINIAHAAGIPDENIILDSGIGFGKTVEQNLELLNKSDEIKALGYPLLIGPSRKSFIGYTLDLPPEERAEGTAAAIAVGITRGADIVRVHDVEMMVRIAKMTDAIVR